MERDLISREEKEGAANTFLLPCESTYGEVVQEEDEKDKKKRGGGGEEEEEEGGGGEDFGKKYFMGLYETNLRRKTRDHFKI